MLAQGAVLFVGVYRSLFSSTEDAMQQGDKSSTQPFWCPFGCRLDDGCVMPCHMMLSLC